jgi:glycosyltransferase 2 family protein
MVEAIRCASEHFSIKHEGFHATSNVTNESRMFSESTFVFPSKTDYRRNVLAYGLKLAGLLVLLAWMVGSGKLNLHRVVGGLSHWPTMLTMLIFLGMQPCVTAWRWSLLLRAQEIRLPYQQAFGFTMIGLLFNVAIPGPIGGDLVKGYYITRVTEGRKSAAAGTILIDRLVGILGLFLLAVLMVVANFGELAQSNATRSLGVVVTAGLIIGMGVLCTAVLAGRRLSELNLLPSVARKLFRSLSEYHKNARVIAIAIAVSVLSNLLPCMAYYIALRSVGGAENVSAANFFLLVPLGFVAMAVPITPLGLGVGQAAFFALFRIVSASHATAAADAFTVYQFGVILISLSGFFWYLSYKEVKPRVTGVAFIQGQ